jgi:hypothetical protein
VATLCTNLSNRTPAAPDAVVNAGNLPLARDWLATAVETTGPEQIAAAKAEIATAAEAIKQLGLSKEIRADAAEMVRHAEYALAKSIRKGQAEGTVAARGKTSHGEVLAPLTVPSRTPQQGCRSFRR